MDPSDLLKTLTNRHHHKTPLQCFLCDAGLVALFVVAVVVVIHLERKSKEETLRLERSAKLDARCAAEATELQKKAKQLRPLEFIAELKEARSEGCPAAPLDAAATMADETYTDALSDLIHPPSDGFLHSLRPYASSMEGSGLARLDLALHSKDFVLQAGRAKDRVAIYEKSNEVNDAALKEDSKVRASVYKREDEFLVIIESGDLLTALQFKEELLSLTGYTGHVVLLAGSKAGRYLCGAHGDANDEETSAVYINSGKTDLPIHSEPDASSPRIGSVTRETYVKTNGTAYSPLGGGYYHLACAQDSAHCDDGVEAGYISSRQTDKPFQTEDTKADQSSGASATSVALVRPSSSPQ